MHLSKALVLAVVLLLALPLAVLASDDPNERKEKIKGNGIIITVRFDLGTEGMGVAKCGTCSTAGGCKSVWCRVGKAMPCRATPAKGWKFAHWTANGNYAGDKPSINFCRKGADLKAHFEQAK
jgi:hypothetical protein